MLESIGTAAMARFEPAPAPAHRADKLPTRRRARKSSSERPFRCHAGRATIEGPPASSDPRLVTASPTPFAFPSSLPTRRTERYGGAGVDVTMRHFGEADRQRLRLLYDALGQLVDLVRPDGPACVENGSGIDLLRAFADTAPWRRALSAARQLGLDTPEVRTVGAVGDDPRVRHLRGAVHDCRGGALQALVMLLQLVAIGVCTPADVLRVFHLTRDHLKIMRNAVPDLDAAAYARDCETRLHDARLLVEKWARADHRLDEGTQATVAFRCDYSGAVAERCIEFAALDRVVYNTVNNAVRHAADGRVEVLVTPLAAPVLEAPVLDLRFEVVNAVTPAQRRLLDARAAGEAHGHGSLFAGGFTTGGSGLGLGICAEFVQHAYGLGSLEQALADGYLGVHVEDDLFRIWFHWPTVV